MPNPVSRQVELALFADDTAILASSANFNQSIKYSQDQITELTKYHQEWKLKANPKKTEIIIFSKKQIKLEKIITPKIDNQHIAATNKCKYLGLTLDKKMNFNAHINQTISKANMAIKFTYPVIKHSSKLSVRTKIRLYKSVIRPIITYGCPIWSLTSETNKAKLQRVQNKILKIITNERKMKIRNLHELCELETLEEHIKSLNTNFYKKHVKNSELTKNILAKNQTSTYFKNKQKLLHSIKLN
jgi:hypothetical protein